MVRVFNTACAFALPALLLCLGSPLHAATPPSAAAPQPAAIFAPGPAPGGRDEPDAELVAAFYKVARAYDRKGDRDESIRYLKKALAVAPRPEVVADAAYRVGYHHLRHLDFDTAERYLQQSLAAQAPEDTTLRLGTQHALAWLEFLRGRPQAALTQARRFNATFASEPLLASVVEKHAWMADMLKDMARLVAIVAWCEGGRPPAALRDDPAFARDFSALLPYLPGAHAAECAASATMHRRNPAIGAQRR